MRFILMSLLSLNFLSSFISLESSAQTSQSKLDTNSSSQSITPASDQSSTELNRILGIKQIEDPNIITDQKLKADEGSRSRYSVKANISYAGPGIADLSNKDQPNPDHVVNTMQTKLNGTVGARYRIDGVSAVNAGTGISAIHPLHGWDRTDVSTPYLAYDRSTRVSEVQIRHAFNIAAVTTPEYLRQGEFGSAGYDIDMVRQIGLSRFSLGLESSFNYYFYGREYNASSPSDWGASRYYWSFYPNLKFKVNDNLNINTTVVKMFYNRRDMDSSTHLLHRTLQQKLGIGYSFAKDVYFNPYITWFPENMRTETTTFNLSAVFSVL